LVILSERPIERDSAVLHSSVAPFGVLPSCQYDGMLPSNPPMKLIELEFCANSCEEKNIAEAITKYKLLSKKFRIFIFLSPSVC